MLNLYPNLFIKNNFQNINNLKQNPSYEKIFQFLKKIEVAVSKGLTKESINESFKYNNITK
jgi:hypothetical protein